jgi:hypothetical protein
VKPCPINARNQRHSWAFVRNVVTSHLSGRVGRITQRGLYRCECGAAKYGEPDLNQEQPE